MSIAPVAIDTKDIQITPFFKVIEVENVPKSERAGYPVLETKEVVEVHFAGTRNFVPVFPTKGAHRRKGHQVITYAEHWADQYRAFKEGSPQEANGTPLEMLRKYGVTSEQISICRALRIYSIEALHGVEGQQAKALQMHQNKLKDAARQYMAERSSAYESQSEIERLKAEIEALKAGGAATVEPAKSPEEIESLFPELTDAQLKEEIEKITGAKPRGNPSRTTLEASLKELQDA